MIINVLFKVVKYFKIINVFNVNKKWFFKMISVFRKLIIVIYIIMVIVLSVYKVMKIRFISVVK